MVFSDIRFLFCFLPIFLIIYGLTSDKNRNLLLVAGSLVFYTWGEPRSLPVLLLSVVINYEIGRCLGVGKQSKKKEKKKSHIFARRLLLWAAVAVNIGALALVKSGGSGLWLPIGMSFYTFLAVGYLIDVYRGEIPAEKSLIRYAAYITMFPRLVSGPLVTYRETKTELTRRKMTAAGVQSGLMRFALGLAAKVLLADRVGILWHEIQVVGFESISTPLAWLGAAAYSLKLYFDFYGYSLMAEGLGIMLGFSLPENFREPYMARSVRDFYRRWHITLGKWFSRYVYVPLGGSRGSGLRTALNLLAVWLLTSVWHGYSLNFLLWGLLLWALIVLERIAGSLFQKRSLKSAALRKISHIFQHFYLWAVIPISWMCFAITDIGQLRIYLGRMFALVPQAVSSGGDWLRALGDYGALFAAAALCCTALPKKAYRKWKDSLLLKILLAALFWVCVRRIAVEGVNPFQYLHF